MLENSKFDSSKTHRIIEVATEVMDVFRWFLKSL